MIINTEDINEARKQIQKLKKEDQEIIVRAKDPEFNRKILEIKDVDVLLNPEFHNRKDKLKQRDSGLNEVLCKIAEKNNIKIGISLEELKKLDKREKAKVISRMIQDIRLCKKTKTKIMLFPKDQKKLDILSFFISLKGSTVQVKDSKL